MGCQDTLGPHYAGEQTYEEFVYQAKKMEELVHYEHWDIPLCSELYARINYRTVYHDKKIFSKEGNYYRPTDIQLVGSNIRHEFVGIFHTESTSVSRYFLSPLEAIQLLAGVESFLSNNLDADRKYIEQSYSLSYMSRDRKHILCISYGGDRKESHLDKYRCRIFAATLKNIISTSAYRY